MGAASIGRKSLSGIFFLAVFLIHSSTLGEALQKTVSFPQEINGREVMQTAVGEGRSLGYVPKREEGKVVLTKKKPARFSVNGEKTYQITLMIAPGNDGRKVLTVEGEYIGDIRDREIRMCFECDIDQIEKAVKKFSESR